MPAPVAPIEAEVPTPPDDGQPGGLRGRFQQAQQNADARAERINQKAAKAQGVDLETSFVISEEGRNGKISFDQAGLHREIKKTLGKDDRQFIPYNSIQFVEHNRKSIGRDVVAVQVGSKTFE